MTIRPPSEDIELAEQSSIEFQLSVKSGPGKPWEDIGGPTDLSAVCIEAQTLKGYEVGIFMNNTDGTGRLYWTSRFSEVFNSTLFGIRQ
jgi:hypothetical protein